MDSITQILYLVVTFLQDVLHTLGGQVQYFHGQAADRYGLALPAVKNRLLHHTSGLHHGESLKAQQFLVAAIGVGQKRRVDRAGTDCSYGDAAAS